MLLKWLNEQLSCQGCQEQASFVTSRRQAWGLGLEETSTFYSELLWAGDGETETIPRAI
jgi:hypothetical protein